MQTLDRSSSTPLHVQLREILQRAILGGAYHPGESFPTEREISATYHVSRTTIREALSDLVRLGYLVRQQGKGTFVARAHDAFDATELSSFSEDMAKRGLRAGAVLLGLSQQPPLGPARQHFGDEVATVWRIYRLRLANDEPIALQTSYLPAERFAFTEDDLRDGSLYAILQQRYGVAIASADEVLSAVVAGTDQAKLMRLPAGAPLLRVERYTYSQTGEPLEYVEILYRADRYTFFVHQNRGG